MASLITNALRLEAWILLSWEDILDNVQEGRFGRKIVAVDLTFLPRMEAHISGSARSDFPEKLCWFPSLKKESCKE